MTPEESVLFARLAISMNRDRREQLEKDSNE